MATWNGKHGRGAMRKRRAEKHLDAEARNAATAHEATRAHREGRCGVDHQ